MQLLGLGVKKIRFTQQGDWLLPLVDNNRLLKFVVILDIILLTEAGRILLSTQNMAQSDPINNKFSDDFKAIVH